MTISIPRRELASLPERRSAPRWLRPAWTRFCRNKPALVALWLLVVLAGLAVAAPLISGAEPTEPHLSQALQDPSAAHLLGTNHLGEDLLARLLYGARYSLFIGFAAVGLGALVGVPLGTVSGFCGGWLDLVLQRLVDVLLSFPGFLLALSLVAILGTGVLNVILCVGLGIMPAFLRLARALAVSVRCTSYVDAARTLGSDTRATIWRHVAPNIWAPVAVQATLGIGSAILTAAGLGFLGLGVQQPTPEWGSMLGEGRQFLFNSPSESTAPGLAIFVAVLAFNLVGDGLRDAFSPPVGRS